MAELKKNGTVFRECLDKAEVLDTQSLVVSKGFLKQFNNWLRTLVQEDKEV